MKLEETIPLLVGVLIGIILTGTLVQYKYEHHNKIIKQGHGQYNSQTSDFEWIKNE